MSEVAQAPHSSPDGHIPQLRFPEFNVSWNEYKLGSITDVVDSLHTTPKDYVSSGFPMIRVVDVNNIELDLNKCLNVSEETYRQFTKKYQPKVGDVVLSRVGTCGASIMLRTKDNVCLGQNTVLLHPKINKDFYHILVKSNIFQVQVSRRVVGSTQKTLSLKDLKLFKLNIPAKPEQQKIAEFLTAVDNKIEQLSKKQALLGEYKKGLMQQIFSQAIRFKADDGSDFPDWEEVKLGNIGEFKTSSVDKKIVEGQKLIQLVNYMNVYKHENIKNNSTKDLMIVSANETQLNASDLKKGDILFTPSSETPDDIGHSVVIFEDLMDTLYSYHLMRFRPKVQLDILYSHYFCNIPDVLRQISRVATGSTRFTISVGEFSKIQINLPSLLEQTKIANFLSAIDNKIEKVGKQLVESKQFKKALLQQMFV